MIWAVLFVGCWGGAALAEIVTDLTDSFVLAVAIIGAYIAALVCLCVVVS